MQNIFLIFANLDENFDLFNDTQKFIIFNIVPIDLLNFFIANFCMLILHLIESAIQIRTN